MDGGAADQMALRQLAQALAALPSPQDGGAIEDQGFPTDVPAFKLGPPHAGSHSLDNETAFEFGDRPDDDHNRPAQWAAGVELFSEADVFDVEPVQLVQHLEEVPHRPGDPVGGPDQHDVELAAAGIAHHGIESWPAGLRSTDRVGILLDDLIAALLGHLVEVVELRFGVLVEGADPHI